MHIYGSFINVALLLPSEFHIVGKSAALWPADGYYSRSGQVLMCGALMERGDECFDSA